MAGTRLVAGDPVCTVFATRAERRGNERAVRGAGKNACTLEGRMPDMRDGHPHS